MKKAMIRILSIGLGLIFAMTLMGCLSFTPGAKIIVGNRNVITQDRVIENEMTGARTLSPIDLILDPSLQGEVVLEGESNILELVDVRQDGQGVVEVGFKPNTSISATKPVRAYIPMISGGLLEIQSTGSIEAKDNASLTADALELRISSTGSIRLQATVRDLKVTNTSTGKIRLTGSAEQAEITLSSTGDFDGYDFAMIDATIRISSTGSAYVNVSGDLVGTISSTGSIIYDGNPVSVTSKGGGGIGSLRKR